MANQLVPYPICVEVFCYLTITLSCRRMYWTEVGYQPGILTALMEGRNLSALVQIKLKWPVGLALDAPAKRLYWCDAKLRLVESVTLDGRDRHLVREFADSDMPATIALHENFLYVTVQSGKLYRLNKFGQGPLTVLAHGLRRPVGLAVYQQQQQHVPSGKIKGALSRIQFNRVLSSQNL